jgi:peptidoglycan/LPS O-acetylase OafA/YrhL
MNKRFYDIDMLRFLAATSVMLMHYALRGFAAGDHYSPIFYGEFGLITRYNYLAVNLFFMISGFVILMSAESGSVKEFFHSRFLRLYPVYWFCCSFSFIVVYLFFNEIFHLSIARYIANITMLNGFFNIGPIDGVYWTLLVEIKFYILIAIILSLKKIEKIDFLLAVWLLFCFVQIFIKNEIIQRYMITNFGSFFIAGCGFYRISKYGLTFNRLLIILLSLPIGIYYELQNLEVKRHHYSGFEFSDISLSIIVLFFYILFVMILNRSESSGYYKNTCSILGKISYPLYLIHFNIGMVMYNLLYGFNKYAVLFFVCIAMIIFSWGINKFIEKPFSAFLKRYFLAVPLRNR